MPDVDLSKLQIDKTRLSSRRGRKRRYGFLVLAIAAVLATAVLYHKGLLTPALKVQATRVQSIYPSQTFTLLNASGYVVAQRKAAVASKITGRLVFLAVEEGNRVKKGELIASLENEDAQAARDRALTGQG
jgi:multidrug efflux pump subunit AcrA (membrane-fusion protein)